MRLNYINGEHYQAFQLIAESTEEENILYRMNKADEGREQRLIHGWTPSDEEPYRMKSFAFNVPKAATAALEGKDES